MKLSPLFFFLAAIVFSASALAQKPADPRLAGLDTLVARLLAEWHAPGVGIAVVEKDKVVYAGGFGYSDYEAKKPVNARTIFAIN
jgi:CubicO group peptidase (beta-lactamase class C family)